jgi:RNA-directed DNA polymerase
VNTGALLLMPEMTQARVLGIQTKLHRWANEVGERRFGDLFNLVHDPAFLVMAWKRVRSNTGSRSTGVDSMTVQSIEDRTDGVAGFLEEIRSGLKDRSFRPLPVRERMIPKPGTLKRRRLGIPTITDRVVQAALKLVLEPIFEADFKPCSYGFRPNRRAHDAIAEIHLFGSSTYRWVAEADIEACFDSIDHAPLLGRIRRRIGDKHVVALVKAFLKSGILTEFGIREGRLTGTPQGGILSPLLANVALSVLDEHFTGYETDKVGRAKRRRHGLANYRLVRYADDFVIMVDGDQAHAEAILDEVAEVLSALRLRLATDKTRVIHLDEGFDFLGFRIQRRRKRGTNLSYVYTYPSKKAVTAVMRKMRDLTKRAAQPNLVVLLLRMNQLLRGWCNYFKHGVSKRTFSYLDSFAWRRVTRWMRKHHKRVSWKALRARFFKEWDIVVGGIKLFMPSSVTVSRYRYRGMAIPTPWTSNATAQLSPTA